MRSYPSVVNPEVAVLLPEGRLDALASPALEDALDALEARGTKRMVLNLRETSYISSSGLRVILIHARRLRQISGDLKLCCLTDKVARVMRMAGFDAVLAIFADEDSAAQAFRDTHQTEIVAQEKKR